MKKTVGILRPVLLHAALLALATQATPGGEHLRQVSVTSREVSMHCYQVAYQTAHQEEAIQQCQSCCTSYLTAGVVLDTCKSHCLAAATAPTTTTTTTTITTTGDSWAPREAMRYCYHYATLLAHPDPRQTCQDCCARYLPAGCPTVCQGLATAATTTTAVPAATPTAESSVTAAAAKRLLLVPEPDSPSRLTVCVNSAVLVSGDATLKLRTCYACCDDTSLNPLLGLLPAMRTACHHECDALVQQFVSAAGSA